MNNPTRLIWSTWPPRCVWSGVFFFWSSNPIETEWSWVVWHTSIYFVLFRHVWLCLVSRVPCVSTLRNLWEPKLETFWTGARLCSPTALWGNKEALWRKLPGFRKTPCYNHAENDVDLKKKNKTHHFANTEGESERLYHPFVVSYLFFKVFKHQASANPSDDRHIDILLWICRPLVGCQDHIRDCSKGDHPGRGLKQSSLPKAGAFWRFFGTCTLHQFVDYLNKPSFMKISGDHRRKPASSRLWPHFPSSFTTKGLKCALVESCKRMKKNKRDMWNLCGKFL